jgi:hypothetical protein
MTGLVRKATLLAVCGLLVMAATALAGIPDPAHCTKPAFVKVVGYSGAVPDARGTFTITVRDIGNFPVVNSLVTLDFTSCTDMRLCKDFRDSVDCPSMSVYKHTDASGNATFTIVGGGRNPGASAGPGLNCITIKADYITIGQATAVDFDENGDIGGNGVTAADFVSLLKDWGAGVYYGRSDFDGSGPPLLTAADFIPWLKCWGDGSSVNGCTKAYCP